MKKITIITLFCLITPAFVGAQAEPPPIGVEEGQMYPDFLLPTVDGELGRLSDFRGKKVFLFNFASW